MKSITDYIRTGALKKQIDYVGEHYPHYRSIFLDLKDIERFDRKLVDKIRKDPETRLAEFKEEILGLNTLSANTESGKVEDVKVNFVNIPTEYSPSSIEDICERNIGQIMRIEGVVAQITDKYPYMTHAHYICNKCGEANIIPQSPNPKGIPSEPSLCRGCHKRGCFRLAMEASIWGVAQVMVIVENPEMLRAGQKPPSLTLFILDDLTRVTFDSMDKIVVDGMLKISPATKNKSNKFLWYLEVYGMDVVERGFDDIEIEPQDEVEIKKLSKTPDLLSKIADSIAPTIYGHTELKKALVLMLLGGTEKKLSDARRRYWINVLAVSDPGTSKSILSNALCSIAPKAIYATGSGSKVGGLTTTAEKETLTGEWIIKPGILPLASGGIVALDEFTMLQDDEMNSMREAMEQGSVSSAKAGKNVKFKAHTAIFACANPKTGRFDDYTNPVLQFGIPAPILSRFDLMFVIRDVKDIENDKLIAKTIFKAHTNQADEAPIERDLIRKYIAYAKQKYKPSLDISTPDVEKELEEFYVNMRREGFDSGVVSATARQYEALVRLAEASAKLHLRDKAVLEDVKIAEQIVKTSHEQLSMIDGQAGAFDIDMVVTGKSKTERDKYRLLELTISQQGEYHPDGCTDLDALAEELGGDLSRDKIEKYLQNMKNEGKIYEPIHGRYKITGR